MGTPKLPDIKTLIEAGINPKTKGPIRVVSKEDQAKLKIDMKQFLRIIDEQDAVNRYVWTNLPNNITSQELERLIYYKGQLAFFYNETLEEFYFMPYALDGSIDFYQRYKRIHPVPMTAGVEDEKSEAYKSQASILSAIKLNVKYGIVNPDDLTEDDLKNSAVLIYDYSKQLSQNTIPRSLINDSLLDTMANMIPFANTKLMLSTGVKGVRLNDADQSLEAEIQALKIEDYALKGKPWIPLISSFDFQELANDTGGAVQDYFLALQSLDNYRLSGYGIDNGGLFEKKSHELQSQADINGLPVGMVLQDGLSIRQNFCNIVNSIWDLGIWCEPAENIVGLDRDGDGVDYEENYDGENSGIEYESEEVEVNESSM